MIRVILIIIAIALAAAGFTQVAFSRAFDGAVTSLTTSPLFRLWGILAILIGAAFIAGSLKKTIELRLFLWVMGWIVAIAGLAMLVNPASTVSYARIAYLDRSPDVRLLVVWLSGLIRIGLGAAIFYAVVKPDRQLQS